MRIRSVHSIGCLLVLCALLVPTDPAAGEILFEDDFEDGNLDGWTVLGGDLLDWVVENGTCRRAVTSDPTVNSSVIIVGSDTWTDYRADFDMRLLQGDQLHIVFRYRPSLGDYRLVAPDPFHPGETVGIWKTSSESIGHAEPFTTEIGVWYHWRLECRGDLITVSVDGDTVLECLDSTNPFLQGAFALGVWARDRAGTGQSVCEVEYDNLLITSLDPDPTATLEPPSGVARPLWMPY